MYIRSVKLKNIRCFPELEWSLEDRPTRAGWHVILGDNGTGKSTFLRAISMVILGLDTTASLLDLPSYLRHDAVDGLMAITIDRDWELDETIERKRVQGTQGQNIVRENTSTNYGNIVWESSTFKISAGVSYGGAVGFDRHADGSVTYRDGLLQSTNPWMHARSDRSSGWFSAGYGSLRRITGGDPERDRRTAGNTDFARHLPLLDDAIALIESLRWLQSLQFAKLEGSAANSLIDDVIELINQPNFLPNDVRLNRVTSRSVDFVDANSAIVPMEDLGDGYKATLAMTLDLVRQLSQAYAGHELFTKDRGIRIDLPGVVLIDEIDVHLHPTWQRQIGPWFRRHFPNIQFIVTTHSPLVCQAAAHGGSVFKLPSPGTDETGQFLGGTELDRLLYGDILDAYSTEAFGSGITRSDEGNKLFDRLAVLNGKALTSRLTSKERQERERLQSIFASSSNVSFEAIDTGVGN